MLAEGAEAALQAARGSLVSCASLASRPLELDDLRADASGCLAHRLIGNVRIPRCRLRHLVSEQGTNDRQADAGVHEEGCIAVAQVVDANVRHTGSGANAVPDM